MLKDQKEMNLEQFLNQGAKSSEFNTEELLKCPTLVIAQKLTPQCDSEDPLYIPGVKPGDWFCPATAQIFGPSITGSILAWTKYGRIVIADPDGANKEKKKVSEEDFNTIIHKEGTV